MPKPEQSMDQDALALQLYTLEYQKAADRYENIYRSIWTIFSYLAATAAGLLTFGSDRIEPHALVCVAASPLIFWFWTTSLPLDRYGNDTVLRRLHDLEDLLNDRFHVHLRHFSGFAHPLSVFGGIGAALSSLFKALRSKRTRNSHHVSGALMALWDQIHRARFAIVGFFIVLHVLVFYEANMFRKVHASGQSIFLRPPAVTTARGTRIGF
jgi:hypothetical protein